jgi:GT2 family glycosyltransferase
VGMAQDAAAVTSSGEPVCSICIANYNGAAVIGPCLESIYDQDCHLPLEIIIHDDASTDTSVDFIRNRFPDVTLIVSESNVGYCVSNNRMVSRARGRYILLLNNDAVLHRDAIRTFFNHAERQPGPAILGLPQHDMQTGELIDRGSLFDPFLNPVPNLDPGRTDVGMVMGACLWIPKSLWEELGGFPEWFGSLAEDLYLCCLARLREVPVTVLPESGYDHWVGRSFRGGKVVENALRTSYQRRALSERNKTFTMLVCYPSPAAIALIPCHLLMLAAEGLMLSLLKRSTRVFYDIYWFSLKSVWEEKGRLWRLRRSIQSTRRVPCRGFFSVHKPIPHKWNLLLKYGLPSIE